MEVKGKSWKFYIVGHLMVPHIHGLFQLAATCRPLQASQQSGVKKRHFFLYSMAEFELTKSLRWGKGSNCASPDSAPIQQSPSFDSQVQCEDLGLLANGFRLGSAAAAGRRHGVC